MNNIKLNKFPFLVVIVSGIFFYTFYDNVFTTVAPTNSELDHENNISFGDLLTLVELQQFVEVPNKGYDITNPTVFFKKIRERNCTIYAQFVDRVFVNCIEVRETIYTVDPSLVNLLLRLNKII